MPQLLQCPNGHLWQCEDGNGGTVLATALCCPICGTARARPVDRASDDTAALSVPEDDQGGTMEFAAQPPKPPEPVDPSVRILEEHPSVASVEMLNFQWNTMDGSDRPPEMTLDHAMSAGQRTQDMTLDHPGSQSASAPDVTLDHPGASSLRQTDATLDQPGSSGGSAPDVTLEKPSSGGSKTAPGGASQRGATLGFRLGKGKKQGPEQVEVPGYEILGTLGRGGLGVVYKARQVGLNRLVALKMILSGEHASSQDVARFQTEAQAVAHLLHPNIVQIYEVSEHNGKPYFSMEFVDGGSLEGKIKGGTPLPPREAAETMEVLARAMFFAHERGIIHRDLKPANVLLAKDGTPKIADFGLAKRMEEEDSGLTGTGAILGTPTYMAPEQAAGGTKEVGPAADIYSLGAMLYDLLTGRPPFKGATVLDTLQQVQSAEPLPPVRLQPKVPLDLQTICLKCLEKAPAKRYVTAGALADDIRRFLSGEPISARPTPALERAWKWAKRRPTTAALLATSMVAAVAIVSTVAVSYVQVRVKNQELTESRASLEVAYGDLENQKRTVVEKNSELEREKKEVVKQRDEAETNFERAKSAVELLVQAAQSKLRDVPRAEAVREDLLRLAVGTYQQFLDTRGSEDPAVLRRAARANRTLARMNDDLGDTKNSVEHLRAAVGFSQKVLAKAGADPQATEDRRELIEAMLDLWVGLENLRSDDASRVLDEALTLAESMPADASERDDFRRNHAALLDNRGIEMQMRGEYAQAEQSYLAAERLLRQIAKPNEDRLRELARVEINLASLWTATQHSPATETRDRYSHAIDQLKANIAARAGDSESAKELGRAYGNFGLFARANGMDPEEIYRDAVEVFQALRKDYPNVPDFRKFLAQAYAGLGDLFLTKQLRYAEGLKAFREARSLLKQLVEDFPQERSYREDLARACNGLGSLALAARQPAAEVQDALEEAMQQWTYLIAKYPQEAKYSAERRQTAGNLLLFHDLQFRQLGKEKRWSEAEKHVRRLLELRRMLAEPSSEGAAARGLVSLLSTLPLAAVGQLDQQLRRKELASTLLTHFDVMVSLRDYRGMVQTSDELLGMVTPAWPQFGRVVQLLAYAVLLVEQDPRLTAAERARLIGDYERHVIEQVSRAVQAPDFDLDKLLQSAEFASLRSHPQFQARLDRILATRRATTR